MHYHFIGIGGIGMSGLARILLEQGHKISGSDQCSNKQTLELETMGAKIFYSHSIENISNDIDFVIVTSAIKNENPELKTAKELNLKIISRSELLNDIITKQKSIAVTGTHGKTTTSSMIATILEKADLDPTAIIGAEVHTISGNAKKGDGLYSVAEVCEYQRAFLDIYPHIAVITNIEEDHLDCYKDIHDINDAFREFTTHIDKDGLLIVWGEDENIETVTKDFKGRMISYGLTKDCDVYAKNIQSFDFSVHFDLNYFGKEYKDIKLSIPGTHNILNALSSIVVAREVGVEIEDIKKALFEFRGAGRRFQLLGEKDDVLYIDDYAHHPTEIQATLKGAREFFPNKRIIAVFQPHQHSRTKFLLEDFSNSFENADIVIMPEIYAVRDTEEDIRSVSSKDVVDKINQISHKAFYFKNFEEVIEYLQKQTRKNDVVITIGAGPVNKVAHQILDAKSLTS